MAKLGRVYHWSNYIFEDKSSKNKYLVILATPTKETDNFLYSLTTSNKFRGNDIKGASCGLPDKPSYAIPAGATQFKIDTWIMFDKVYEIPSSIFQKKTLDKEIKFEFDLICSVSNLIRDCAIKSEDMDKNQKVRISKMKCEESN